MNRTRGIYLLIATSVLWSFAGICIKLLSWNGYAIAGLRGLIAAMMMLILVRTCRGISIKSARCFLMWGSLF